MHLQVVELARARHVFLAELVGAPGHGQEDGGMPLVDILQQDSEVCLLRHSVRRRRISDFVEGRDVPSLDELNRGHLPHDRAGGKEADVDRGGCGIRK